MLGIYRVAAQLVVSQVVLSSTELLSYAYGRFEIFTAVTMKNAVFWDIKTQFVPHRRIITYPLQSSPS
jgi:hypothetical protein